jgi:hypothetical protein
VFFLNADASAAPFRTASFDAVLASLVVYLLADPGATVARWRNLLQGWNAFRQRHGWTSVGLAEALLDGYGDVRTVAEPVATRYESPDHSARFVLQRT